MMTDLMDENVGHNFVERILAAAPEVEQRPAIEPYHVGQFARLCGRSALRQTSAAKQAQEAKVALGAHLLERLVVGKIGDLNDQAFAETPERSRQPFERGPGERGDVFGGWGGQRGEVAQCLGGHCAARGLGVREPSNDLIRVASSPSTRRRVRMARAARIFSAPAGNSASTRRNVSRGIRITTASSAARALTRRAVGA